MGTCFDCYYGKKDICPLKNPYKKECAHKRTEATMKIERRRDNAVCEAYKSGKSAREIGEEFKISQGTLYTILARNDVELRTNTPSESNLPEEEIINALASGSTQKELAEKFGTSRYQIAKIQQRKKAKEVGHALYSHQPEKPHSLFHPAELNNRLVWKMDVNSLEELIEVSTSLKEQIVIDGGCLYLQKTQRNMEGAS